MNRRKDYTKTEEDTNDASVKDEVNFKTSGNYKNFPSIYKHKKVNYAGLISQYRKRTSIPLSPGQAPLRVSDLYHFYTKYVLQTLINMTPG